MSLAAATSADDSGQALPWRRWLARLSIYGDFWLRYLTLGVAFCPWFIEPLLVGVYTTFFYLLCAPARRALCRNLAVLFPDDRMVTRHARAWRVMWNFAWSLVDAAHARAGRDVIDWEVAGFTHLDELANSRRGALILTAHMGSYDLAAPLFARGIKRPLHLVRAPERQPESQDYASRQGFHQHAESGVVVHYNEPGNMLAVKLAALLGENEIVAIQGDRILFEVAAMKLPFSDTHEWNLPKGPFLLGMVSRCQLLPLFITRSGWRRYRVTALPPYRWPEGRLDKEAALREAALWWSDRLAGMIRGHWKQWFVFEPAFSAKSQQP